jgi:uncharacterized iron-regulated protein
MRINAAMSRHLTARAPESGDADLLRSWASSPWDRDDTAEYILELDSDDRISFIVEWKGDPISFQSYVKADEEAWYISEYFAKQNSWNKMNKRDYNYLKYNYPNLKHLIVIEANTPAEVMTLTRNRLSPGIFEENGLLFI